MNKYSYFCEKEALEKQFRALVEDAGDRLVEYYLANGFEKLSLALNFHDDFQKEMLFDFLMLDRKALLLCLRRNKKFFLKMITDGRGGMIRSLLGLQKARFDALWREALDLLALYFSEKKVLEKLSNLELEKFFQNSILGGEQKASDFN